MLKMMQLHWPIKRKVILALAIYLAMYLCSLSGIAAIIVEDPRHAKGFVVGKFHFSNYSFQDINSVLGSQCNQFSHLGPEYSNGGLEALARSVDGWSLEMIVMGMSELHRLPQLAEGDSEPQSRQLLSNRVCISLLADPATPLAMKEMLYQLSLVLDPRNVWTIKNYGFHLEWHGFHVATNDLFKQCVVLTRNAGCISQYVFLAPPILDSVEQQRRLERVIFQRMLRMLAYLARTRASLAESQLETGDTGISTHFDPIMDIRELPLNPQYSGANANAMYALWSRILSELYPSITSSIYPMQGRISSGAAEGGVGGRKRVITLGLVAENGSNSSPLLCFFPILEHILGENPAVGPGQVASDAVTLRLHYFAREEDRHAPYFFEQRVRDLAAQVTFLASNDLQTAREMIAAADVDILMYLALPTEKFTFLLAHARLAPVQLHYGIGHPLNSGIDSVAADYYVVPLSMVDERAFHANAEGLNMLPGDLQTGALADPVAPLSTAQTVYLSELGYYLNHPLDFYTHTGEEDAGSCSADHPACILTDGEVQMLRAGPQRFVRHILPCETLERLLLQWGMGANLTADMVLSRCAQEGGLDGERQRQPRRLYFLVQLPKKLHPVMDALLFGILEKDPQAMIVLSSKALGLVDRWRRSVSLPGSSGARITETEIFDRVLFLPRVSHLHHLTLLSMSAVFLNPLPFGAGVTSSEALALCVPIVSFSYSSHSSTGANSRLQAATTHSNRSSILQFALAQIATLGPEFVDRMIVYSSSGAGRSSQSDVDAGELSADDIERYVDRAVQLASNTAEADAFRAQICEATHRLFGAHQLVRVAREWQQLLLRLV